MNPPIILPPLVITQGLDFSQSWRIEDPLADPPVVPLAGWAGEIRLFPVPFDAAFYVAPVVIADDRITVAIDAAQTSEFAALPFLRGRPNGVYQITLTAPLPAISQVWQGSLTIAGVNSK